jgi:TfoX/Sxy family transcriptional regulator of competence genes
VAYSDALACRVRDVLADHQGVVERRMFGSLGFLLHDRVCVGVWETSLIARIGPGLAATAVKRPHVRPFDVTGRPMRGWVLVDAEGVETDEQLRAWIRRAVTFVQALSSD